MRIHMLSIGRVTLLDLGLFGELCTKLNIWPHSPTTFGAVLGLQNE